MRWPDKSINALRLEQKLDLVANHAFERSIRRGEKIKQNSEGTEQEPLGTCIVHLITVT